MALPKNNFPIPTGNLIVGQVGIANAATVSDVINTQGLNLVGLLLPSALTGTTISFQGSLDGTNFDPVYSTVSGTALSYTVAQGHYVAFDPTPLQGLPFIKLVSGTSEAAARTIGFALKG
jgi:hypothetical protein